MKPDEVKRVKGLLADINAVMKLVGGDARISESQRNEAWDKLVKIQRTVKLNSAFESVSHAFNMLSIEKDDPQQTWHSRLYDDRFELGWWLDQAGEWEPEES